MQALIRLLLKEKSDKGLHVVAFPLSVFESKIRPDWLSLRTSVRKQPIIALYTEFETVLKFYNLKASFLEGGPLMWMMPMHLHINQNQIMMMTMIKDLKFNTLD